jgi:uncharacterized protein (TIGR03435 family)
VKVVAQPGRGGGSIGPSAGGERFRAAPATLRTLIVTAYHVSPGLVSGGPSWIDREWFEVDAKAERPASSGEMRVMLRNLLADRFSLRVRQDTKEMPVYALMVDRGGVKLALGADQAESDPAIDQSMDPWPSHRIKWNCQAWPMDFLAERVAAFVNRPVLNQTGLPGRYDFHLTFVEDLDPAAVEGLASRGIRFDPDPTIFEALRRQLGLRLEPRKGPVETIVVEGARRPDSN